MALSATHAVRLALDDAATARGPAKRAAEPHPSVAPATPRAPASVLTARVVRLTTRMASQPVSATKTLPYGSPATPKGDVKSAALPSPSAQPAAVPPGAPPPASVDMNADETLYERIRLLPASAMSSRPSASKVRWYGLRSNAAAPTPSA